MARCSVERRAASRPGLMRALPHPVVLNPQALGDQDSEAYSLSLGVAASSLSMLLEPLPVRIG